MTSWSSTGATSSARRGAPPAISSFQVGPSLANLKNRAATTKDGLSAEQYVRESILAPTAFRVARGSGSEGDMPTLPVNADELNALVAYLLTL
jgi:hypothetical protein